MPIAARPHLRHLPQLLIAFRVAAAPLLAWDAWDGSVGRWYLPLIFAAFVSDVLDGVIARRLEVSTETLRMADSLADIVLYVTVAAGVWWTHPDLVRDQSASLIVFAVSYAIWWAVNLARYGKPSSYHTWIAKVWNGCLCFTAIGIYSLEDAGLLLMGAAWLGVLRNTEEIAMSLVLPRWTVDVPGLWHALRRARTTH